MTARGSRDARASADALRAIRPLYELRAAGLAAGEVELSIWQLPGPATPRLAQPERTASLHGRALRLIEPRILRRLKALGISLRRLRPGETDAYALEEDAALALSLFFRVLAPMRSIERIRRAADGIDRMSREEAGYWLGMAVHRVNPRRVLAALRVLLTSE